MDIKILKSIPQQPQAQYSVLEQLKELTAFANRLGLYDAHDWLVEMIEADDDLKEDKHG